MKTRLLLITVLALLALWAMAQPVVITPPLAVIEPGESVTLTASGALYYQWSPATGLSTTEGPVTVASPMVTTTYTCSGYAPGAESVVNGGFSQGNVGFSSAYEYNTNLWGEGTYYVDADASLHHENFHGYGHGDNGNFMIVNGATVPRTNVWTEEISVVPNTYYAFSTWVCTLAGQANEVALLQFSINGQQIGDVFSAPSQTYVWEQFYELWYSGNSTTATITILNQNTVGSGNDFGLDDISFCALVLVGAPECTVSVESLTATATADETELCEGASTTLHALPSGGVGNYTYSWSPTNTLDDPSAQHPVATPAVGSTTYTCHISDGYTAQDVSVTIIVHSNEVEDVYETICANSTFDFYGQQVSHPDVYEHHLQTQFGCDKTLYLHLENWPVYDETVREEYICHGETYEFYGNTYNESCQVSYTDQSVHGCDSVVRLNLTVYPANDTTTIDLSICHGEAYEFYGNTYNESCQVSFTDQSVHGCDSVVRLNLTVYPANDITTIDASICHGEAYEFYGNTYNESCQVSFTDQSVHGCDSVVRLNLTVYPANDTITIDPSICVGETYNFHGSLYNQDGQIAYFDTIDHHGCLKVEKLVLSVGAYQMPPVLNQYECYEYGTIPAWTWDKTGITYHQNTIDEIILDDPEGGCPIKHRLNLNFHENYYHEETKVACDEYYWTVNGMTYYTSQDRIEQTYHNSFGDQDCDSTYILHLEISNYETNEFTVSSEENCDSYYWDPKGLEYITDDAFDPEDHVYTQSGTYHRTYQNIQGCDSLVTMHVQFDYTPTPTPIYPMDSANTAPHWVVTATEFQINEYDFYLWDSNPLCRWDTVTWMLDSPAEWVLEPFGDKGKCCKVFVLNKVYDTIWLRAYAFNRCAPDEGIEQKFWLLCSFYGVDEQKDGKADFTVSPNPNNGLMAINFENLTGGIQIKVFDLMGNLLDVMQIHNETPTNSAQYDMRGCADGIYFFVATGKEGMVTKKVVVKK